MSLLWRTCWIPVLALCLLGALRSAPASAWGTYTVMQCDKVENNNDSLNGANYTFSHSSTAPGSVGGGRWCPASGGDTFGSGAGLGLTTCPDPSRYSPALACTTADSYTPSFSYNSSNGTWASMNLVLPGNTSIYAFNGFQGIRTQVPYDAPAAYDTFQWWAGAWTSDPQHVRAADGTVSNNSGWYNGCQGITAGYKGCYFFNDSCTAYSYTASNTSDLSNGNCDFSGLDTTSFSMGMVCVPYYYTQCSPKEATWSGLDPTNLAYRYHYQARLSQRQVTWTLYDKQNPGVGTPSGALINSWLNASASTTQGVSATYSDNVGVSAVQVRIPALSASALDSTTLSCSRNYEGTAYTSTQPCPTGGTANFSVSISGLGDGIHSVYADATDASGLTATSGAGTLYLDRTAPSASAGGGCASGLGITLPGQTGSGWVSGTISLSGTACDPTSGLSSAQLEYSRNNGGWNGCGSAASAAADTVVNLSCSINTTAFSEGDSLRFRVKATDVAGNTGYTSYPTCPNTNCRYVDNTPPTVSGLDVSVNSPASATLSSNRWTNARVMNATWSVSAGSGSPIASVWYDYQNGPIITGSCTRSSAVNLGASATSTTVANSPTACQQGTHTVQVWAVDQVGNSSASSPASTTYRYDSVAPDPPVNGSVTPSGWSTVNSFRIDYTNPSISNTATESPFVLTYHRIGSDDPPDTDTTCLGSGAACTVTGVTVPPVGGVYSYQTWLKDEAGNADPSGTSWTAPIRFNDSQCPR